MTATASQELYEEIEGAYAYFNEVLFDGQLPGCLFTLQRKSNTFGYYSESRFLRRNGEGKSDEIALNPAYFAHRRVEQTLSTLAHEQVHQWQAHFGKRSRSGYHNAEWANKMQSIGLMPSDTGEPGGKRHGQQMTHYIAPGGSFQTAFADLDAEGFDALYVELWGDADARKKRKAKSASKTRYTCPSCELHAWAKPGARLACGECDEPMAAEDGDDD